MSASAGRRRATTEEIATAKAWIEHHAADWVEDDDGTDPRQDEYEHALELLVFANDRKASSAIVVGIDATSRTEYNIRFRNGSGQFVVDEDLNSYDPPTMGDVESDLLGADAHPVHRDTLTWPDGSRWTGPWQKVPAR